MVVGRFRLGLLIMVIGCLFLSPEAVSARATGYPSKAIPIQYSSYDYFGWRAADDARLLCVPDRSASWLGEPVSVSYYLTSSESVGSFMTESEDDHPGYGKAVLVQPTVLDYQRINYGGKAYNAALIKRLAVFPQQTGRMQLPTITGKVDYYFSFYGLSDKIISSTPVWIEVRPLPAGKPTSFSGAIGNFQISQSFSSGKVKQGEALLCTVRISGKGNFSQISAPPFPQLNRAQISDPTIQDDLATPIEGTRLITYTILPQASGTLTVPGFSYNWFNTATGRYDSYQGPDHKLEVEPSNVLSTFSNLLAGTAPPTLNPLLPRSVYPAFRPFGARVWFWAILLLLACTLPLSWWLARERRQRDLDPAAWRRRKAGKSLAADAKQALEGGSEDPREFFPKAEKALRTFLVDRWNLSPGATTPELLDALASHDLPKDTLDKLGQFLKLCQDERYRPPSRGQPPIAAAQDIFRFLMRELTQFRDANPRSKKNRRQRTSASSLHNPDGGEL